MPDSNVDGNQAKDASVRRVHKLPRLTLPAASKRVEMPEVQAAIVASDALMKPAMDAIATSDAQMKSARDAIASAEALGKPARDALASLQKTTQAYRKLMDSAVNKNTLASVKMLRAATKGTGLPTRAFPRLPDSLVVSRRLDESLRTLGEHKSRVEWATIHGAEATKSLVDVAGSQEKVLVSMDGLLAELVKRQGLVIEAQLRERKSNRRWRWAVFLVALGSLAVAVLFGLLNLLG